MAKTFGAGTGVALTGAGAVLQSKTTTPRAESVADALDEYGDVAARQYYGGGVVTEVQETYAIKADGVSLPALGYNTFGVVTNIEVSTSNSDWPQVSITFTTGATLDENATFALPSFTIVGKRLAQTIGITGVTDMQSSSFSASCDLSEVLDASGEPVKFAVSNGTWEANAEYLDGTATAGLSGTLEETGTISASNTAWQTISAKASGYIARTSPSS